MMKINPPEGMTGNLYLITDPSDFIGWDVIAIYRNPLSSNKVDITETVLVTIQSKELDQEEPDCPKRTINAMCQYWMIPVSEWERDGIGYGL